MNAKLQQTRNYSLFVSSKTNRVLDPENLHPKHKNLKRLMHKHGFLPSFPITARQVGGKLRVEDGQHRLHFAKMLGLEVYYVVISEDIDVAEINQAQASWQIKDYTNRWAAQGNVDYVKAHEFAARYGLSVGNAFALLTLNSSFGNISKEVKEGTWKITDFERASVIGQCYADVCAVTPVQPHQNLFKAIYACNFVADFDAARLVESIQKRAVAWINGGHWLDYLQQIEEFYNFGRKTKLPLKFEAQEAMRSRNAARPKAPKA